MKWEDLFTLFVDNMLENAPVVCLRFAFSCFGKAADAYIPLSSTRGKGKCFGFVRFRGHIAAQKAIAAMNGTIFMA